MQTITGYYNPIYLVVLGLVGPTSIRLGAVATWVLDLTLTAAVDLSEVTVLGGFDPSVTVEEICVDGVCTEPTTNSFSMTWATMFAGTSHDITVTMEGSFDSYGAVNLIRDWPVAGISQSGTIIFPVGGPVVTVDGSAEPVGGQVCPPSATAMFVTFLPWVLLTLAAVGAGAMFRRKRYSPRNLASAR
jgi:hypothetical protein